MTEQTLYGQCLDWAVKQKGLKVLRGPYTITMLDPHEDLGMLDIYLTLKTNTSLSIAVLGERVAEGDGFESRAFDEEYDNVESMDRVLEILTPYIDAWKGYREQFQTWALGG